MQTKHGKARVRQGTIECGFAPCRKPSEPVVDIFFAFTLQDEKYDHIEAEEIKKVEDALASKDEWLNNKWNAQNKLADHQDPAVYASVILSEKKVMVFAFFFLCLIYFVSSFCFAVLKSSRAQTWRRTRIQNRTRSGGE